MRSPTIVRRGVYQIKGTGTVVYEARFYRNTGNLGGYIAETDEGKKIHVPGSKLGEFRQGLDNATKKVGENYAGSTLIKGEQGGVRMRDCERDEAYVTDGHANRILNELDEFVIKETVIKDRARRM